MFLASMLFPLFYCFCISGVRGLCTLVQGLCLPGLGWSLWWHSLQPRTVMSLSVVGPPKVASSAPQVSLPSHVFSSGS